MTVQKTDFASLIKFLHETYDAIPFSRVLGLRVIDLKEDRVGIKFEMKEGLVGNTEHGILHGGVISSALDATGGIIAAQGVMKKMAGKPFEEIKERVVRIGTIDLRVDFLRPGLGKYFLSTGSVMRTGNKVVVIRTELRNDQDVLIAVGTGTYMMG